MVAGIKNGVSGGNVSDIWICLFCVCLTKGETFCLHVSWRRRMWRIECTLLSNEMFSVTTERVCVCVFVLFCAESTFVCVGHANSTQQELRQSMNLILKWILCYLYRAFPYIPYFNEQNALIKIQYNITKHTSYHVPTPVCFSPKMPSSENLLKNK